MPTEAPAPPERPRRGSVRPRAPRRRERASAPRAAVASALVLLAVLALAMLALAVAGCYTRARRAPLRITWVSGATAPAFDPDGPPHALRWALERLLSHGLVDQDSSGRIVAGAASSWESSADGMRWSFHLRPGLKFVDGTPCSSEDIRRAIEAGLARRDHATRDWLLGALEGADRVRAGRPLPELGLETPDPGTLVLRLSRPDSTLLQRLALPGVSAPWRNREAAPEWAGAVGLGPYRMLSEEPRRRMLLARAAAPRAGQADTIDARFGVSRPRLRALLRSGVPDLVWPEPPGLSNEPLPAAYRVAARPAWPARRLLLVMRADGPPTSRLETRHALTHATNLEDLLGALGRGLRQPRVWLPGASPFEYPRLDANEARDWMRRGHLGRSFHVTLAFDADGAGELVARALQGQWSRLGIYVELRALRGPEASAVPLEASPPHLLLVEAQALLPGAAAELATLVMPYRGPAVGAFRTGFRTREFDRWLGLPPGGSPVARRPVPPLDASAAQRRLDEERIALPLADLPWIWLERVRGPVAGFSPRYGPDPSTVVSPASPGR